MRESVNDLAKRGLALLVLLLAAFIVFKIAVGVAMGLIWTLLAITVIVAAIWALSKLL
jgi:predicted membrane protein